MSFPDWKSSNGFPYSFRVTSKLLMDNIHGSIWPDPASFSDATAYCYPPTLLQWSTLDFLLFLGHLSLSLPQTLSHHVINYVCVYYTYTYIIYYMWFPYISYIIYIYICVYTHTHLYNIHSPNSLFPLGIWLWLNLPY